MKLSSTGIISNGSSLTLRALCPVLLPVLQPDSAQLMWNKTAYFAPSHGPNRINKSELWTSVSVSIMDDIAEGPAGQRGWVPGRNNEPPFSCGKIREALVTSISNLSKSAYSKRTALLEACWDGGKIRKTPTLIYFDL